MSCVNRKTRRDCENYPALRRSTRVVTHFAFVFFTPMIKVNHFFPGLRLPTFSFLCWLSVHTLKLPQNGPGFGASTRPMARPSSVADVRALREKGSSQTPIRGLKATRCSLREEGTGVNNLDYVDSTNYASFPGRPGGCPPGPPQIRTCPIKAYGSSSMTLLP